LIESIGQTEGADPSRDEGNNEAATLVTTANMIRKRGMEGDNGKHESNHKRDDKDKNSIKPLVRSIYRWEG
jgi:hypothetical protein